jgi:hypothetical protein
MEHAAAAPLSGAWSGQVLYRWSGANRVFFLSKIVVWIRMTQIRYQIQY